MKKSILILALLMGSFSIFAQNKNIELDADSVINKISKNFVVVNDNDSAKLIIDRDGEMKIFLDGNDMFIRDGNFEVSDGVFTPYEFLHIDGGTGRIGFNILSDPAYNELPLTSSVHLNGSIATRVRLLNSSTSYVIKQDDHIMIIDKQDNTTTEMTLPAVLTSKGREYIFKRNGNNDGKILVKPHTGEKLDGETNGQITLDKDNASLEVVCDGFGWWALSEIDARVFSTLPISQSITVGEDDFVEVKFTSDNPIVLTLPAVSDYEGKVFEIKRNDAVSHTNDLLSIKPAPGETLDQYTNTVPYEMSNDWESVIIRSTGTNWFIVGSYGH